MFGKVIVFAFASPQQWRQRDKHPMFSRWPPIPRRSALRQMSDMSTMSCPKSRMCTAFCGAFGALVTLSVTCAQPLVADSMVEPAEAKVGFVNNFFYDPFDVLRVLWRLWLALVTLSVTCAAVGARFGTREDG